MSTRRIITPSPYCQHFAMGLLWMGLIAIFFFGGLAEGKDVKEDGTPIFPFLITDASGKRTSDDLFTGRWVVFAVIGDRCPETDSFISFRKTHKDTTLILCIGAETDFDDPEIALASPVAMKALGLTGTPMILGIENHRVIWRLAGLAPDWELLVEDWLRVRLNGHE